VHKTQHNTTRDPHNNEHKTPAHLMVSWSRRISLYSCESHSAPLPLLLPPSTIATSCTASTRAIFLVSEN
jgi:hypothetical protein